MLTAILLGMREPQRVIAQPAAYAPQRGRFEGSKGLLAVASAQQFVPGMARRRGGFVEQVGAIVTVTAGQLSQRIDDRMRSNTLQI